MSLSKTHRATLERHLKAHAKDIADLRATRASLEKQAEQRKAGRWSDPNPKPGRGTAVLADQCRVLDQQIERHLALIELGRDERVLHALSELVDHPELVAEAARDPRGYAKARGIKLPVTMQLDLGHVDGHPHLSVVNYDRLAPLSLVWDREGFRLIR